MQSKPYPRGLLYVLAVPIFGFILLNATFVLDYWFGSAVGLLFPDDFASTSHWFPPAIQGAFAIIVAFASWRVFRTNLSDIYKATYAMVPAALVFVGIGISLYRWPLLVYSVGILAYAAIAACLYRAHSSWIYYYAVTLVAAALLTMGLLGIDI